MTEWMKWICFKDPYIVKSNTYDSFSCDLSTQNPECAQLDVMISWMWQSKNCITLEVLQHEAIWTLSEDVMTPWRNNSMYRRLNR